MATRFPPDREGDLLAFVTQYSTKITATPTVFGLVAGQATAFAALKTSFANYYAQAQDQATRTPLVIEQKKLAKAALLDNLRQLTRIIEAYPSVTDAMRVDLGIPVRDGTPSPTPVPEDAPRITVLGAVGRRIKIRLGQIDPLAQTAKPAGAVGASVFTYVGIAPPTDLSSWKFEGNLMRTSVSIDFPLSVAAFARVWITAFWFNRRGNSGPACEPVGTNVGADIPAEG